MLDTILLALPAAAILAAVLSLGAALIAWLADHLHDTGAPRSGMRAARAAAQREAERATLAAAERQAAEYAATLRRARGAREC